MLSEIAISPCLIFLYFPINYIIHCFGPESLKLLWAYIFIFFVNANFQIEQWQEASFICLCAFECIFWLWLSDICCMPFSLCRPFTKFSGAGLQKSSWLDGENFRSYISFISLGSCINSVSLDFVWSFCT